MAAAMTKPVYRRVVVKVSGEALMGPDRQHGARALPESVGQAGN